MPKLWGGAIFKHPDFAVWIGVMYARYASVGESSLFSVTLYYGSMAVRSVCSQKLFTKSSAPISFLISPTVTSVSPANLMVTLKKLKDDAPPPEGGGNLDYDVRSAGRPQGRSPDYVIVTSS